MKTVMWKRMACAITVVGLTTMAVRAKDVRTISIRDNCDQATFDAAFGPGTCVGDGDTTLDEFLEALADGGHPKWRFNNDRTSTDFAVNSQNRGGETHTFTEVEAFGGGFIPDVNMGLAPVPECVALQDGQPIPLPDGTLVPGADALASLVPPGGTTDVKPLSKGRHRFQCCIHPWMRSVVDRK